MSEQITCFFQWDLSKVILSWLMMGNWKTHRHPFVFLFVKNKNFGLIFYPHLSNIMRAHLDIRLTWLWALLPQILNKIFQVRTYFIDDKLIVKCWSCTSTKFQSSFWEPKNCNSRLFIAVLIVQCTFAKVVSGKPPEF